MEALLEGRGWHTHCVCVYRRELMLNISMFMLQQSHSLCSVIRDILICTFRCCLCRVYVSIFIFSHPFAPVRNAFLSAGAFFIRFAPSFCPRLDSSTTGLGGTQHTAIAEKHFVLTAREASPVLVRSMSDHCV